MKKLLILLQFLLSIGQAIASPPPKPLPPKKTSVLRVMPYFINPEKLLNFWGNDALPAEQYTRQEIALQKQLNELEDGVITYAPKGSVSERDIDQIAITPYTWKWISLEHQEPDGTFTKASLRRPNAWLIANHVTEIGAKYHLQVPSAGIDGQVTITAITPNQLDSRFWNDHRQGNYVARPITGFFEHSRSNLVAIKLIGQDGTTEVTDNHLFFSQTRNDWVSVANLNIGEQIKTRLGTATLEAKTPKQGIYTVYDLELYQDHNFLAGNAELLVHNSCELSGSYTITFESGKKYHGKGSTSRMEKSALNKSKEHKDKVVDTDWTPSKNEREAFKDESRRLDTDKIGDTKGYKNKNNYNKRDSPGAKYRKADGEN